MRRHPSSALGAAGVELLGDVRHDPAVGRRGGREHRHAGGHARDEVAQASVVGAEVVAPVADAVRLVDDEQSDARDELRQLLVAERRVVEPLGRHQQHVDLVAVELGEHVAPLVRVGGVDLHRPHPRPRGCRDLVAHEREQRRDEHRRPGAAAAQQQRRDEVDRRLAPPGALHDECPAAVVDERLDRLELPVVEVGVVAPDERAQHLEGLGAGRGGGCHGLHPARCRRQRRGFRRKLGFTTAVFAPFVPLAAALYLATTVAWTLVQRVVLRRRYPWAVA